MSSTNDMLDIHRKVVASETTQPVHHNCSEETHDGPDGPPKENMYGPVKFAKGSCTDGHPTWYKPVTGLDKGLKVLNTLSGGELVPFIPAHGNKVLWYTCGPTVYDSAHMGHARAYLTFDILRRIMEDYFNYEVLYHVNITDIDDKIILRARRNFLLKDFYDTCKASSSFGTFCDKVREALPMVERAMAAKGEMLAAPLPDTANSKDRKEREEELKKHAGKMESFEKTKKAVEDILKEAKQPTEATMQALLKAAGSELSELLDLERGSEVVDQEIFDKHARYYEREYFEDMEALGVREPDVLTRVTEYLPKIIDFIKTIVDKGLAYESNGSVYLSISEFVKAGHDYRKLVPGSEVSEVEMAEGEGALGSDSNEKRHKNDFALWKKSKAGEPRWESPWGLGRPGWHIECSVVASDILGPNMDVHAGGVDLRFPHHDNELAQSEACYGHHQWVNYFFHAGHLHIKGLKMSKSLKNFITIRQALKEHSPREIRMMFLLQSWHKDMNYSDQAIEDAKTKEKKFREFFHTITSKRYLASDWMSQAVGFQEKDRVLLDALREAQEAVDAGFKNNFDTSSAVLALFQLVTTVNSYLAECQKPPIHMLRKIAVYVTKILKILGISYGSDDIGYGTKPGEEGGDQKSIAGPYMEALCNFRQQIRTMARSKPPAEPQAVLKECDALRDDILPPLGVRIEDFDNGTSDFKFDDPKLLMREVALKRRAQAEAEAKKIEGKLSRLTKDLETAKKYTTPPTELFRSGPYAAFDESGLPTKDAAGEELAKSTAKKLSKELKAQEKGHGDLLKKSEGNVAGYIAGLEEQVKDLTQQLKALQAPEE